MKHLLNTLYVTTQGSYLHRQGETVVIMQEGETRLRIPVHPLAGIVCFGRVSLSPPLMGLCAERRIAVSFLSRNGRFWARVEGPVSGNVLLRREQYRQADDPEYAAENARSVVLAKVHNCRVVLQRALREHPGISAAGDMAQTIDHLYETLKALETAATLDGIRGLEGEAARSYFTIFNALIYNQKEDFFFRERNRPWKRWDWTRRWDACTEIAPAGPDWLWT
jgi:CRISPR-associated protein Cas1